MKTEVSNEFILEAHKSACNKWKLKIEKECPELFESKLEVGKWYKNGNGKTLFCYNGTEHNRYGFNSKNEWENEKDGIGNAFDKYLVLATEEEVKEALIKEAKKRGFKIGVKINRDMFIHNTGIVKISSNDNYNLFGIQNNLLQLGGNCIFENGKWAEIISNPIEEKINDLQKQLDELKKQL